VPELSRVKLEEVKMDCLELSRLLREAEMKVAAKMAAEQKGELFYDDNLDSLAQHSERQFAGATNARPKA
jgi:hypothetical protein